MEAVEARRNKVTSMIGSDALGALKESLQDPPTETKDLDEKRAASFIVYSVISAVSDSKTIREYCTKLSGDELDLLVNYLYRMMDIDIKDSQAVKGYSSSAIFKWIKIASEVGGLAVIIRAMTEKRSPASGGVRVLAK